MRELRHGLPLFNMNNKLGLSLRYNVSRKVVRNRNRQGRNHNSSMPRRSSSANNRGLSRSSGLKSSMSSQGRRSSSIRQHSRSSALSLDRKLNMNSSGHSRKPVPCSARNRARNRNLIRSRRSLMQPCGKRSVQLLIRHRRAEGAHSPRDVRVPLPLFLYVFSII